MKKILKFLAIVIAIVVIAFLAFFLWLVFTEYKPAAVESVPVTWSGAGGEPGETISVLTWNIGYCGLGENADFVLDGGNSSGSPTREEFETYYNGILNTVGNIKPDICLLQEVDANSSRSYSFDAAANIPASLAMHSAAYALNYSCKFVPFPWPPIGKVNSGILTMSGFTIEGDTAERVQLPVPFKWPVRMANLKRCLLVSRVELPGSGKELVIVNLHLEAYDDGEGKAAQTAMLFSILQEEYEAGNYVIAGGDFNQTFPGSLDVWPVKDSELWTPGVLDSSDLPEGWSFVYDSAIPTCRLLNMPYDPVDPATQYYVIDGFILSPNVELRSVETLDAGFRYSDHNPVLMEISLAE